MRRRPSILLLLLLLLCAAPLSAQTATNACGPFSVSRGAPVNGAVPLTFKGNCILPRDTVRITDTVTKTVTVVRVDTVRIGTPVEPPVDTVTPPPVAVQPCLSGQLL